MRKTRSLLKSSRRKIAKGRQGSCRCGYFWRRTSILAICTSLPLHAQANQPEALNRCISTLTTAGAIFVRTHVPSTHVVVISKHIDLAFRYLQGAEALARLLPQAAQNPIVMYEAVLATSPESVSKVERRIPKPSILGLAAETASKPSLPPFFASHPGCVHP